MTPRRILAVIALTVLLLATSAGAACEISCSFPQNGSDCHSSVAHSRNADHSASQMDGMDMSGMPMPNAADKGKMAAVSSLAPQAAGHPTVGVMGPCERQSCDERSIASVRSASSLGQQLHANVFIADLPRIVVASALVRYARARDFLHRTRDASPPVVSLRI